MQFAFREITQPRAEIEPEQLRHRHPDVCVPVRVCRKHTPLEQQLAMACDATNDLLVAMPNSNKKTA
jgi:hypothetical protein